MKKVFSGLILVFTTPFSWLKKRKFNNFVGGLIFGAIFSLVVNIATVQVQELIQKQRILEAVENEILNNALIANQIITSNNKILNDKERYNPFHSLTKYSRDLWEQSSEPLQYIAQLDQPTQIAVIGYYSMVIPSNNRMLDSTEKLLDKKFSECLIVEGLLSQKLQEECDSWYRFFIDSERSTAIVVADNSFEVLKKFHPTKDRLDSWFLKILMGKESTRVLSGK